MAVRRALGAPPIGASASSIRQDYGVIPFSSAHKYLIIATSWCLLSSMASGPGTPMIGEG